MSRSTGSAPTLRRLVDRFAESECSWLTSVRPDGRAHSVPVWHVWHRGRAYVVTSDDSVKVANVQHNPHVVIAHPDPLSPVIIEGYTQLSPDTLEAIRPLFRAKYNWDPGTSAEYGVVLEIKPAKLIAWGEYGEGRWFGDDIERVLSSSDDGGSS